MQDGKVSNLEINYSKKKIQYLIVSWGSLLLSGAVIGLLYLLDVKEIIIFAVIFALFIFENVLLMHSRTRISYFDLKHRYQLLTNTSVGLEKTNCKFDNNWIKSLQNNGYHSHVNKDDYTIYYKIGNSITNRSLIKKGMIEIITVFRNSDLDFYGDVIEEEYKSLWMKYEKEHKLNKQVIIQFKKYDSFDEKIKSDLDQIIAYKYGDNHLVQLNCGFFSDTNSIYYLHSKKYHPSVYYKRAVETIESVIKY